jgi:hypothetical protein
MNSGNYRAAMSNLSMLLQVRERVEGEVKASARNDDEHRTKPNGGRCCKGRTFERRAGPGVEQWGCTAAELGSVDSLSGHWPGKVEGFFCNPRRQTLVSWAGGINCLLSMAWGAASTRVVEGFAGPGPEVHNYPALLAHLPNDDYRSS